MLTMQELTDAEQVQAFKIEDELVANGTMDEASAKVYAVVCIERARAYAETIRAMTIPLYLRTWASEMAVRHATTEIKVHHNYLPWLEGLLVTRYGEAVEHWPAACSDDDVRRAREWKTKGVPMAVVV